MTAPALEFSHPGMVFVYLPLFVYSFACKLFLWFGLNRPKRATLSSIPGPKLARWTRFWIVKTLASGDSAEIFVAVNKRYGRFPWSLNSPYSLLPGPLARIGPNHLLTNDPTVTRRILGARSGYSRGPWFDSLRIDPRTPNIVSERDEKKHARLRYKLAGSVRNSIDAYPTLGVLRGREH